MVFIHKLADVATSTIGEGTKIWQFVVVLSGAKIGANCICAQVLIENDVVIGDNVTVKSGVQLWDGVRVGDNVFIGPNVTFTNDLVPRSKRFPDEFLKTIIGKGVSIGANSTIVAGNTIGNYALLIVPGIWQELNNFSSGAICLIMASELYQAIDYIK